MQFLVTIPYWPPADAPFWLRGTVWTGDKDRASTFATREEAQAARNRAMKFNPKAAKASVIVKE